MRVKKLLLTFLSLSLTLSLICLSAFMLADKTQNAYADDVQNVNADYVDVPYEGRTKWTNSSRPLGFVLYLKGVSFAANQVHLQNGIMTAESLAKITFTRGETSQSSPVLVCATKDGAVNKSCFCFFFGGALVGETENTYQEGDRVIIEEGCILKCAEGSFNVAAKIDYEYNGSSWVKVVEEKEWAVTNVTTSIWVHATARKLGVDIYRSSAAQTVDPLTDNNTGMLALVNDSTKVTYTRNGISENPNTIVGNNAYVAYCFKGDTIGAADTTPLNGDLFTIETGFVFKYNASDANRYYAAKLQYEYFNGTWKTCSYSGTGVWANSSLDAVKSIYSSDNNGIGIRAFCTDKTISAAQTDGIQNTVFDLNKITLYRQGSQFHPTRIIGAQYTMNYLFKDVPNDAFISGDMLQIEKGFSFIYNDLRYTYDTSELYVFTGSSWQVPSLSGSFKSMNVKLNENINAEFTCTLPVDNFDEGETRLYLTVSGEQTTTLINSGMETKREDGNVFFKVPVKLDPTLLTADIQFYFRWTSGGTAKFSKVFHKTVKEYCDYYIENPTSDEQADLVKALLNYGGYSQTYYGVNTGNLANTGLYEENPIDDVEITDGSVISETAATGLSFTALQLFLDTTPTMRFYFELDDGYSIGNYSFKLVFGGKDYRLTPDYDEDNKRYYVDVENIPARHIGSRFTISAANKDDDFAFTVESSINCYIKTAIENENNGEAKKNMLKALYWYGVCAAAYAG